MMNLKSYRYYLLKYYVLIFYVCYTHASFPLAILHVIGPSGSADICAIYNPRFSAIPYQLENTPKYKVFFPDPPDGCTDNVDVINSWNSSWFVTSGGNCSQSSKFQNAYHANAKQVIVINSGKTVEGFDNDSTHKQVHLSTGMIASSSWEKVKGLGTPMYSQLYHPHDPLFDPNIFLIWFIAVFTVCTGAYWCGVTLQESGAKLIEQSFFDLDWTEDEKKKSLSSEHPNVGDDDDNNFPITMVMVAVFVLMICTVLLLLYFFYKYLIYVVIALFAIASVSGTYECLSKLLSLVKCGRCTVPENNLPVLKNQPEVRNVVLFFACVALSIFWVIVRNESYAWMLQDFLGVCFCISLIKLIKLPNLKISAILLVALLVYDIFFVFITPFFSARGKSVMVEVATGNGSKEQLPMVIKVPKLYRTALALCERPYSLLGFGDILLPGLFVAFCHNFDVIARTKYKVYFVATSIAYGLGLAATFVALLLMRVGQPALLYLAPSVLIAATIVGLSRGEMRALWRGRLESTHEQHQSNQNNPTENEDHEHQRLLPPDH